MLSRSPPRLAIVPPIDMSTTFGSFNVSAGMAGIAACLGISCADDALARNTASIKMNRCMGNS
jgi:hypothetical protein